MPTIVSGLAVVAMLMVAGLPAEAQQLQKVPRIVFLISTECTAAVLTAISIVR